MYIMGAAIKHYLNPLHIYYRLRNFGNREAPGGISLPVLRRGNIQVPLRARLSALDST